MITAVSGLSLQHKLGKDRVDPNDHRSLHKQIGAGGTMLNITDDNARQHRRCDAAICARARFQNHCHSTRFKVVEVRLNQDA